MAAISSDNIVKSVTERRLYRFIKLNNGLCAVLIHDPNIFSNVNLTEEAFRSGNKEDEDDFEDEDEDEEESFEDEEGSEDDDIGMESSPRTRKNYNDEDEFMDEDEDEESLEEEDDGSKEKGTEVEVSVDKKAAAVMCVAVGSFVDPNEAQGLAYFLGIFS